MAAPTTAKTATRAGAVSAAGSRRVNDVTDKVDEAHQWTQEHASIIGTVVASGVAVAGAAAFCGATAGVGCLIIAGAVARVAGSGLGYGTRVALDENESFSAASLAKETIQGGATGAVGGASVVRSADSANS
jgi:hypothetical protein